MMKDISQEQQQAELAGALMPQVEAIIGCTAHDLLKEKRSGTSHYTPFDEDNDGDPD